ncbi:MAG: helix-turn-helix transcriptional regulator [Marinifilaceae bacterium]
MSSNMRIPKICQHCGTEFIAKTTTTKFCSHRCSQKAYKVRKRKEKVERVKVLDEQKVQFNLNQVEDKPFLSIQEACQLLGASRMTLYRQIKKGTFKVGKLGRRTIIQRSEIEKIFY